MSDDWTITSGPGLTALGLAAARSVETARPDRLIEDPYAERLFAAAGAELPMLTRWPPPGARLNAGQRLHLHGSRYIGVRTRAYDDALLAAGRAGIGQAVILGAGLDTRAFRLALPGPLHIYELDAGGVLAYKDDVLTRAGALARCRRTAIGVDLRGDWVGALLAAGLLPDRPTAWLAEGLLAYLPPTAQAALLARVTALSAPTSRLMLDAIAGDPQTGGRLQALSRDSGIDMGQLLAAGEAPAIPEILATSGWRVDIRDADALARSYGRDLSDPFGVGAGEREPPWLTTRFVCGRRSDG